MIITLPIPTTVVVVIYEPRGLINPITMGNQDYQSLMGMEWRSGEVAAALSIVWWLTYEYKNKMRNYANGRKLVMTKK